MLNQPTSSPMITRMLGGLVVVACAFAVTALPASTKTHTSRTPRVAFLQIAARSILLSVKDAQPAAGRGGYSRRRNMGACYGACPQSKGKRETKRGFVARSPSNICYFTTVASERN